MDKKFQWTTFYMELATALLQYKNNRTDLIKILRTIFAEAGMNFPFKEKGVEIYEDICPFTVFGSFNKGITNANRIALSSQFWHHRHTSLLLVFPAFGIGNHRISSSIKHFVFQMPSGEGGHFYLYASFMLSKAAAVLLNASGKPLRTCTAILLCENQPSLDSIIIKIYTRPKTRPPHAGWPCF